MGIYDIHGNEIALPSGGDFPKPKWIRCLHRGKWGQNGSAVGYVPENTALAFYLAAKEGSGIECDLQHCSDGVIVMSHNTEMDGTLDGEPITDRIDETAYATVSRVVRRSNPLYGDIGYCRLEDCLRIAYFFGVDIVMENKAYTALADTAEKAAQAVVDAGMSGHATYNIASNSLKQSVLAIDPLAKFHFAHDATVDTSVFTPDRIVRTVNVSDCTQAIVRNVRAEGSQLYIWSVNASNYAAAMDFCPDFIEFMDNIDGKALTEAYTASQKFVNADI